ncbi:MAG: NHL repeat-containing protein [Thermodesulfobacteriota bacterium]
MISRKSFYLLLLLTIYYSLFTITALAVEPRFYRYINGPEEGFKSPSGIFVDREEDEIYVADNGSGEVYILERDGYPLFRFGKLERLRPVDLVVWNDKIFIVEEGGNSIEIYNYRGEKLGEMTPPDKGFLPGRMALDEGLIYVIAKKKRAVYIFDPVKGFKRSFPTGLKAMAGIAVSGEKVYVSAPQNVFVIHVFDREGNYLSRFGRKGLGKEFFTFPGAMTIDEEERLWVIDVFNHRVKVFNEEEKGVFMVDGHGISFPVDLEVDTDKGLLYILEKGGNRISVFKIKK